MTEFEFLTTIPLKQTFDLTYNVRKQSCMSPHSDSNTSHHVADGIAHSLTMLFFSPVLVLFFLCTVLLRTSRCQAQGGHDSTSEDKSTSPYFFFSWNLSYAMRDGTSVATQQLSRKLPRERQTCQLISLSLSFRCAATVPIKAAWRLLQILSFSPWPHAAGGGEGRGGGLGLGEETWPWCWKWIQCAWVFIYDLTNELPVSSETALKERLDRLLRGCGGHSNAARFHSAYNLICCTELDTKQESDSIWTMQWIWMPWQGGVVSGR